jgi:parallel beta-helix repeat protein
VECLFPGDTLLIRGGVYTAWEDVVQSNDYIVRSGTASQRITIGGYPGEVVEIRPPNGRSIHLKNSGLNPTAPSYITFQDLVISGASITTEGSDLIGMRGAQYNIFQRLEIKDHCWGIALHVGSQPYPGEKSDFNIIRENTFHNIGMCGVNIGYPIYLFSADNLIERNEFYDNGGFGVHIYDNDAESFIARNRVIGNIFRRNGLSSPSSCDIAYGYGPDSIIANNLFVGGTPCGIYVGPATVNLKIYNNTFVGTQNEPIQLTPWYDSAQPPIIRNNIFKDNGNGNAPLDYRDPPIAIISDNFSGDPLFVNEATGDYRLQEGSPAENTGVTLAEVPTDFAGIARPQGPAYDKGAHERLSAPPPTNNPPLAGAGVDQTITLPATASLSGSASDDGLPNPPATLTKTWSKVSGPGTVTFGNANALSTNATFSVAGVYVLRLTASDSVLQATDDVTVTVNAAPPPPPAGSYEYDVLTVAGSQTEAQLEATINQRAAQGWRLVAVGSGSQSARVLYFERTLQ